MAALASKSGEMESPAKFRTSILMGLKTIIKDRSEAFRPYLVRATIAGISNHHQAV